MPPRVRTRRKTAENQENQTPVSIQKPRELDEPHADDSDENIQDEDSEEDELNQLVLGGAEKFKAELHNDLQLEEDESDGDEVEAGNEDEDMMDPEGLADDDLFVFDDGETGTALTEFMPLISEAAILEEQAAWHDSDDERLTVSLAGDNRRRKLRKTEAEDFVSGREYTRRLMQHHEKVNPTPEWALQSERPPKRRRSSAGSSASESSWDEMEMDDTDLSALPLAKLLRNAGSLKQTSVPKRSKLRPEVINIQRSKDIPGTQPSAVTSLSIHPKYPIILSSGPSSTLYLHQIDASTQPDPHPQLLSVHVKGYPVSASAFLCPTGDKVVFAGKRSYFHVWDLASGNIQKTSRAYRNRDEHGTMERFKLSPTGEFIAIAGRSKNGGVINILNASTAQWIAAIRVEGKHGVADFAWWASGQGLSAISKAGEVSEWSLETRCHVGTWKDHGAFGATTLALGGPGGPTVLGGDRWLAIGSQSGMVNVYDRRLLVNSNDNANANPTNPSILRTRTPEPKKTLSSLTTAISHLTISPDGQLLAMSSRTARDALRLVHLPTASVFRNWPTSDTPLGKITATAFAPPALAATGSTINAPDGGLLVVGNEAGRIRLWEIRS